MAENQYTVKKITDLATDAEVTDSDLMAVGNAGTSILKKLTFGNLANYIRDKLKTLTFSSGTNALTTTNKTLPGAVNELNSKAARLTVSVAKGATGQYDFGSEQTYRILLTGHNSVAGFRGLYILLPALMSLRNTVIPWQHSAGHESACIIPARSRP